MASPKIDVDRLRFRSYILQGVFSDVVVNGPCYVTALYTTQIAAAGFTYQMIDGVTSQGVILFTGGTQNLQMTGLRLVCNTGFFYLAQGGATQATVTALIAVLPDEYIGF